ncbi:hypothetical protein GCM10027347_53450 [Larkinella harenae]
MENDLHLASLRKQIDLLDGYTQRLEEFLLKNETMLKSAEAQFKDTNLRKRWITHYQSQHLLLKRVLIRFNQLKQQTTVQLQQFEAIDSYYE